MSGIPDREAVRTETKGVGFKQRIGYGGNGVKAIMVEEFASIGWREVSGGAMILHLEIEGVMSACCRQLRPRRQDCEREEEFWWESGEVMRNLCPRWETSCDGVWTDTARRATEAARKWWAGPGVQVRERTEECDHSYKQCDLKGVGRVKAAEDKVAESRRRRCWVVGKWLDGIQWMWSYILFRHLWCAEEKNPNQRQAMQFAAPDCTPRAHFNGPTITARGQNGANCTASAHASHGHAAKTEQKGATGAWEETITAELLL